MSLEIFLSILYFIYKWLVLILGNFTLFIMIGFVFYKIYEKIMIKKSTKKFAKELIKNKFMEEVFKPMTDEEKANVKTQTKITLDFSNMSVKKENK